MIIEHLRTLLASESFEPFRINLVNAEYHDVFDPLTIVVELHTIIVLPHDQNWAIFPIDKINSIVSLIADYQGQALEHAQPPPERT